MSRVRIVVVAGLALAVLWLGVCAIALRVALTPQRVVCGKPADDGVAAEAVAFTSADGETPLKGWLLGPRDAQRGVVLVHGMDSCGWAGQHRDLARVYATLGFGVVVFDLRGQGESGGSLIGLGWKERDDVAAAVQLLRGRGVPAGHVGLHGTSYGAGTSLLSAAMIPDVGAVVADSAWADIRPRLHDELARKVGVASLFAPGITLIGKVWYGIDLAEIPPVLAVPRIAPRPIFFLHGSKDDRIPVEDGRRLKAAARADDELWILEGAGHTEGLSFARDAYLSRTTGFLARNL